MWDHSDWNSNEDLSLPSNEETYIEDSHFQSSASHRGEKGTLYNSSFPRFRLKMRALLSKDRSRPSIPEIRIPSNADDSNASQSISSGEIANTPKLLKRQVDSNGYASHVNRSECNLSSGTASNLSVNLQTPRDQSFKDYLSDSPPTYAKRNSIFNKVVRSVTRSKRAVARPTSSISSVTSPQPPHGPIQLEEELKENLPNPFYRAPSQLGLRHQSSRSSWPALTLGSLLDSADFQEELKTLANF